MSTNGEERGETVTPSLFGYAIDSDIPLSRCRPAPAARGILRVRRAESDLLAREGELISWDDEDGNATLLATAGPQVLFWCSLTGAYAVDGARGTIEVQPAGEPAHWEHRLTATVLPVLLTERGDLALHAAAVASGDGAIVFCGRRGAGKSTLAAALAVQGHTVLAEDGVVLSDLGGADPLVWPGPDGVRIPAATLSALCGDEPRVPAGDRHVKTTQLLGGGEVEPCRLRAVVLLGPRGGEAPTLQPVDPVEALAALVPHALFRGHEGLRTVMERIAALVTETPVFAATLPDRLAAVSDAGDRLLGLISAA